MINSLFKIFSLLVIFLSIACSPNSLVLYSSHNYGSKPQDYKSFSFLSLNGIAMNPEEENIIRKTIYKRLIALGYEYNSHNPDLYVGYRLFLEPATIEGFYESDQGKWRKKPDHDSNSIESNYNDINFVRHKISLPANSYILNFLDSDGYNTIWQGYLGQNSPWNHIDQLKASVILVMDEYKLIAYDDLSGSI